MSTKFLLHSIRPALSRPSSQFLSPAITSRLFQTSSFKMGVHNINSKADFYKAINGEEVTLAADNVLPSKNVAILDCFATWCGPCKTIAPIYAQLSEKYTSVNFLKIDVDEVPDLSQELGIRAMPTFMVFKDGEKVEEIVGANPPALEKALLKYSA
ncbi:hypothetical protein BN1723_008249 [Verticillium longisporum]|nr:hypothetical protein BN1708_006941 [Verticillium longisporum]CRK38991.1 hypothetical protein BN1723_015464 [Verticillium longisporum]CRK48891.1 hypothetical protein BN1723_008249 [Verticillium longisporum]